MSNAGSAALTVAMAALLIVAAASASSGGWAGAAAQRPAAAPEFVQPGRCYRIAFSIDGAPNFKVLELLDGGWMKAEVDAGSAKAERPPLWINTAQIVTMRGARCSE